MIQPIEPDPEEREALDEEERELLEETWRDPRGMRGFFTSVDHKTIGRRFVVTALAFLVLGGLEAVLMRLQLSRPENDVLGPDLYNQVFTVHGTTMMFLFAVPVMQGMATYLVPLMLGTRNAAFPRLNAFAYHVYLIAGLLLYIGFFLDIGPDAGWFSYVPLAGPEFSPGKRPDIWAQMVSLTEISALATAVNVIATVFKLRAPGMSLNRMPHFVWTSLVTSFMIVFAMPAVMLATTLLALDRLVDTHFFNYGEGGDVLLWQHMFWFFGHPEVYIIFLPALGIVSSVVMPFAQRPLVGYWAFILSTVATGFLGFGVWVHHMFATGLPQLGHSFFTAASLMIVLPTGTQIFCWLATLWAGTVRLRAPLLFVLGFIVIFVVGGLSGVMLASVPLDLQVHDTYFVVAHLHYVLIGGALFPLFGGILYWFPKATGRMPSERLGRWSFGLLFVGFNLVFFPMHQLGLRGMTRRVYTYLPETGWGNLNALASAGALVLAAGMLVYFANLLWSRAAGPAAGSDPWSSDGLEWGMPSPPPPYNFLYPPTVRGRDALWSNAPDQPVVTGLRSDRCEVLVTKLLDAEPDHRDVLPWATVWPVVLAVGVSAAFIVSIFTPWGPVIAAPVIAAALVGWFWPRGDMHREVLKERA